MANSCYLLGVEGWQNFTFSFEAFYLLKKQRHHFVDKGPDNQSYGSQ